MDSWDINRELHRLSIADDEKLLQRIKTLEQKISEQDALIQELFRYVHELRTNDLPVLQRYLNKRKDRNL